MTEKLIYVQKLKYSNPGIAILIIAMLAMVIVPLPTFMLDLLFSFNITISLLILMVCLYIIRPLEFSVFPTILLITTLLRLTLNIASTRVVLLNGHEGASAAGEVIRAFGEVVIGGNFVVGLIIFVILLIINFIVVTKGAGRISEVSARFTLDAMPGKQMAIDADLNAGAIGQDEAKKRRQEIIMESDFYGSMDGASKFVRGDAVAGLLILFINLIGGIIIGTTQYAMSFTDAAHTFSILTIGDGLVAQIPSLLLSIAAAIMVTRVSNEEDISKQTMSQIFNNSNPVFFSAVILITIALIPGMPHAPLLIFGVIGIVISHTISGKSTTKTVNTELASPHDLKTSDIGIDVDWSDVATTDRIALELGYGLIQLVGTKKDGQLVSRIKGVRKKVSQKLGILIPSVHIKDNFNLGSNVYRIYIKGVIAAESSVYPDKFMAISAGGGKHTLPGLAAKDPTFGLDCYWITENQKDYAQGLGFTIVDASTVIATHINQIMQINAAHIIGYEEVQQLLTRLAQSEPKLAETINSSTHGIPITVIFSVLQKLLHSGIPIIDFTTFAETMIEAWGRTKDPETLTSSVRVALKHLIVSSILGNQKELSVAVLDNELVQILLKSVQLNQSLNQKIIVLEPGLTDKIFNCLLKYVKRCEVDALPVILLLHDELREVLERLFKPGIPSMHFLAFSEIPDSKHIKILERIG